MSPTAESPTRFVFTKHRLDAIGPHRAESPSSELELYDVLCTGLHLMVSKGDPPRKRWSYRYRYRGRKLRLHLGPYEGMTLKAARESGATLFEVQHALGHASSAMTQRYAHLLSSGIRARAEIAGDHIMAAIQAQSSDVGESPETNA